ncbi:hypothetical protein KSP39_PZI022834 [Platanthera zijinensis]|uniref:Uncharacterized protein n=1 Tax=Platanthera zijinensis TaxID=2320716 RepID=A0AAP0AWB4_9ASPA
MAGEKRTDLSTLDAVNVPPLPHPVLLFLLIFLLLAGISSSSNVSGFIIKPKEQMSLGLFLGPVAVLLLIRFVPSAESLLAFSHSISDAGAALLGYLSPYSGRCFANLYDCISPQDGCAASPWGVAAAVVLLIVLASFRSVFLDKWALEVRVPFLCWKKLAVRFGIGPSAKNRKKERRNKTRV